MEKQTEKTLTGAPQAVIRKIWLHYYNNILLEKGIITKEEYLRMKHKINSSYPSGKS